MASLVSFTSSASAQSPSDKGRYLATLGDCAICHTAPSGNSPPFAGGYPLHAIFGTIYSPNLTPDRQTGIGSWTSEQFYRALNDGIAADGHYLYPAFPYPYFRGISREDSDAIFAFMRTIKPVRCSPPPNKLVFPTNIRALMIFWDALFLPAQKKQFDASNSTEVNRGRDLVNGLAHCGGCHTPKTFFFSDKMNEYLQGEMIDGWWAPNLTSSPRTGLGKWTAHDIEQFLKTGDNRFGRVLGSMQNVIRFSTSHWTDADRHAAAIYLKGIPAAPERVPATPDPQAMHNGQAIFVERCSACHEADTKNYPPLAGNAIVQARDSTTVVRVILEGSQSTPTANGPVGFSMPAFSGLDDDDLADVATYIRNSWGNRAEPVSRATAAKIRRMTALIN
jgi:mono/diheme cytochrome c family protein